MRCVLHDMHVKKVCLNIYFFVEFTRYVNIVIYLLKTLYSFYSRRPTCYYCDYVVTYSIAHLEFSCLGQFHLQQCKIICASHKNSTIQ